MHLLGMHIALGQRDVLQENVDIINKIPILEAYNNAHSGTIALCEIVPEHILCIRDMCISYNTEHFSRSSHVIALLHAGDHQQTLILIESEPD
jgi:hypothetical protein